MRVKRPADLVLGLVFAALGVGIIAHASGLRSMPGTGVGSGLFPTITGAGMVVFGLVLAAGGLVRAAAVAEASDPPPIAVDWPYAAAVLGGLVAAVVLMPTVGFLITMAIFGTAIGRLGGAGWLTAGLFSTALSAALAAVFVHGLGVPLPRGLLGV